MQLKGSDSFLPYGEAIWGEKLEFEQQDNVKFWGAVLKRTLFLLLSILESYSELKKKKKKDKYYDFTPRTYQSWS